MSSRSEFRSISTHILFLTTLIFISLAATPTIAKDRHSHIIKFRSPNLYPEGIAWDPSGQHFIAGSIRDRTFVSISDASVVYTLLSDPNLPPNSTILGLTVDNHRRRLLAAIHSVEPLSPFNALAAYDLRTLTPIFLSPLPSYDHGDGDGDGGDSSSSSSSSPRDVANDVAFDFEGNAYVTNSGNNYIWKVNADGEASILSRSPLFTRHPVNSSSPWSYCGLNGIAYVSKGYLLVVQSNTGKLFKVDAVDGRAWTVILNEDLPLADDIVMRKDGDAVVVSMNRAWLLKSRDSWSEGVVFDKTALDVERFPTSLAVGGEGRVYVLYGHVDEGMKGEVDREWFSVEEVRFEKESEDEKVWVYVLIGFGLAYFLFWRFQMSQLVKNVDRKRQ